MRPGDWIWPRCESLMSDMTSIGSPKLALKSYKSYHSISYHITSHRIASHPIPSHHITSHHITSHHIISYHIVYIYIYICGRDLLVYCVRAMVTLHSFDMLSTLHTYCLPCLLSGMKGLSFQKQRCTNWSFWIKLLGGGWTRFSYDGITCQVFSLLVFFTCFLVAFPSGELPLAPCP